jgi:uncharacterized protein DUF4349
MRLAWGQFSNRTERFLKNGWLLTAGLVALYLGFFMPRDIGHNIAEQKATGLGAVAGGSWTPVARWRATALASPTQLMSAGILGGIPGGSPSKMMAYLDASPQLQNESLDRKLIRNCFLNLVVKNPAAIAEKVRTLAEGSGGFLVSSTTSGVDSGAATLTIRVPAQRFDEIRSEIRKLGLRVDSEKLDAQDVTRQYVDQEARLRNLHAEEAQYLSILKRATNVKDTLEVTEKLNAVRGEIEQQQAEFNALSKQVETVALTISLYAESDVQVFGLNWRPLFQLKLSARDGVLALGDYVASITAFLFYLPAILLWVATIVLGAAAAWRLLKWVARVFFGVPKPRLDSEAPASS